MLENSLSHADKQFNLSHQGIVFRNRMKLSCLIRRKSINLNTILIYS